MALTDIDGYVEVLVVAGGGCGGATLYHGAGGGAGGVTYVSDYLVHVAEYYVFVGIGGTTHHINGQYSYFDNIVSLGGGAGGDDSNFNGNNGGSGGGATKTGYPGVALRVGGNKGGTGYSSSYYGQGGGGGAGTDGVNGTYNAGGKGGDGTNLYSDLLISSNAGVDIDGVRWIGGGGGGSTYYSGTPGIGGKGGGGNGSKANATPGIANTGGGGGGSERSGSGVTGTGGSGIVIISYKTEDIMATGGIITISGSKTIHKFIVPGIFKVISTFYSNRKRNIWYNDPYIYKATKQGVEIYNSSSEILTNSISLVDGANSIWANSDYFYVATTNSGIYRGSVDTISGTLFLEEYRSYPFITANDVNYLHGSGDYLCASTVSGVDRYKFSDGAREYIIKDDITKCFQTSTGDYYYTVNPFNNVIGLDDNIFGWEYNRLVDLLSPIPENNYQFLFEIPMTQPDEIYRQSQKEGADIRIVDDKGVAVFYYIESWNYITPPKIWVKLSKGTEKFYILYGNPDVKTKSSQKDTFTLFDDFNESTLSNNWTFANSGYANNTYTISNSILRLNTYSNSYPISLISSDVFSNSVIEYSFRTVPPATGHNYDSDLDWEVGFNGGAMVYIGCPTETPHYLSSASNQGIKYGTKLTSYSFKTHTFVETLNYQMSNYDGETLVSSGILTDPAYRQLIFTFCNDYYQPKIEIDWIRVRHYDPSPSTYTVSRGSSINDIFQAAKLCAVYNSGGGYEYISKKYSVLRSSYISDIYVTEGTSKHNNGNVIFIATPWGAIIIEEKRGDEINSEKRIYLLAS